MKYNNKTFVMAALLSVLPFKHAQADIISFDINANQSYQRVTEQTLDGSYTHDAVWNDVSNGQFVTSIDFDVFSDSNLQQTQQEYSFDSDGATLAWWMTTFFFEAQNIDTPFQNELLGHVNFADYSQIMEQYIIFAGGTYHYFDPSDDADVREKIEFRREVFGYTITDTADGQLQRDFTYWQQFSIDLPAPLSFAGRSYFDSAAVDSILKSINGSTVFFETFLSTGSSWNSSDFSQMSYSSMTTGYQGYGSFRYSTANQVSAPSALSLLMPFLLLCFASIKRRK